MLSYRFKTWFSKNLDHLSMLTSYKRAKEWFEPRSFLSQVSVLPSTLLFNECDTSPSCFGGLSMLHGLLFSCINETDKADPLFAPFWKSSWFYSFRETCSQSWTSGCCIKWWSPLSRTAREPCGFYSVPNPKLCLNINSIMASLMLD